MLRVVLDNGQPHGADIIANGLLRIGGMRSVDRRSLSCS